MTVVVTGATGHLGGNLVRALLSQGRRVRALIHRDRRGLADLDVELCEGDICDPASLRQAFQGADVVYHTAAHVSIVSDEWALLEKTNIVGARNVLDAVQACGVRRLIHFSSIHALEQEPLDEPLDESRALATSRRVAPYDRSKAMGDSEVRRAAGQGLDAVILYPTAIIGPYDWRPSHVGDVLLALCCRRMPALVSSGFDWVDVRDVVAGALQAEHVAAPGSRYLLSGHWASVKRSGQPGAGDHRCEGPLARRSAWIGAPGRPLGDLVQSLAREPSALYLRGSPRLGQQSPHQPCPGHGRIGLPASALP